MNEVVKRAWANAKNNSNFICVETYSGYRMTSRDYKGPQHLLPPDASDELIGKSVLDALAHSRFVASAPRENVWIHPEAEFDGELYDYTKSAARHEAWTQALMTRYGYKSKQALFKGMRNCSIERSGDNITITPTRHEKLEAWNRYEDEGVDVVTIHADSTPEEIGAALRLAFSRCTE